MSPEPRSAGVARRALGVYCLQFGVPERLLESGGLAISELVTNAVVHARTSALVLAEYDGRNLTLAVADGASAMPMPLPPDRLREGGRGVAIIEELGRAGVSAALPKARSSG